MGVSGPQVVIAGSATTGFVPSPAESMTAECVHDVVVSVTVKVTASGTAPDIGTTESVAVVGPAVFKFVFGLVVVVIGMYTPHGSDVGAGDMYLVPVHVAAPYGLVDV